MLFVTAATHGCSNEPAARNGATASECSRVRGAALSFSAEHAHRVREPGVPASVLALSRDSVLAVGGGAAGAMLYVPRMNEQKWISAPEPLYVLSRSDGVVYSAGVSTVYMVQPSDTSVIPVAEVPLKAGSIVSLVADSSGLWAASADASGNVSTLHRRSADQLQQWSSISLSGPVRLERGPQGGVVAALVPPPHTLFYYDSTLSRIDSVTPSRSRLTLRRRSVQAATATQALVMLECGAVLQLVVDLRTAERTLHLYAADERIRLLRSRELGRGVGLVHAMSPEPLLLGVSSGQGWWEAVLFRWSWTP